METAKFELLDGNEFVPKMATDGSAAYDLYCPEDVVVPSGRSKIRLKLKTSFGVSLQALIEARSGFELYGFKGVDITTGEERRFDCDVLTGKVDSDFRGEVSVIVKNVDVPFICKKGTGIAQLTFVKIEHPLIVLGRVGNDTERGNGGFGHSDKL